MRLRFDWILNGCKAQIMWHVFNNPNVWYITAKINFWQGRWLSFAKCLIVISEEIIQWRLYKHFWVVSAAIKMISNTDCATIFSLVSVSIERKHSLKSMKTHLMHFWRSPLVVLCFWEVYSVKHCIGIYFHS